MRFILSLLFILFFSSIITSYLFIRQSVAIQFKRRVAESSGEATGRVRVSSWQAKVLVCTLFLLACAWLLFGLFRSVKTAIPNHPLSSSTVFSYFVFSDRNKDAFISSSSRPFDLSSRLCRKEFVRTCVMACLFFALAYLAHWNRTKIRMIHAVIVLFVALVASLGVMLFERLEYWLPHLPNPVWTSSSTVAGTAARPDVRVATTAAPVVRDRAVPAHTDSCSIRLRVEQGRTLALRGVEISHDAMLGGGAAAPAAATITLLDAASGTVVLDATRVDNLILLPDGRARDIAGDVIIQVAAQGVHFYPSITPTKTDIFVEQDLTMVTADIPDQQTASPISAILFATTSAARQSEYIISSSFASYHFYSHLTTAAISLATIIVVFWNAIRQDKQQLADAAAPAAADAASAAPAADSAASAAPAAADAASAAPAASESASTFSETKSDE
jgi:hypothetical protein